MTVTFLAFSFLHFSAPSDHRRGPGSPAAVSYSTVPRISVRVIFLGTCSVGTLLNLPLHGFLVVLTMLHAVALQALEQMGESVRI